MPGGRPTVYTQELADEFCALLAEGKSMRKICESDKFPSKKTIFNWLRTNPEFLHQYEISKDEAADSYADEIVDIADNETGDTQRDRLRVDARKWVASKLKPKKYGDKLSADLNHTGEITVEIKSFNADNSTSE